MIYCEIYHEVACDDAVFGLELFGPLSISDPDVRLSPGRPGDTAQRGSPVPLSHAAGGASPRLFGPTDRSYQIFIRKLSPRSTCLRI